MGLASNFEMIFQFSKKLRYEIFTKDECTSNCKNLKAIVEKVLLFS